MTTARNSRLRHSIIDDELAMQKVSELRRWIFSRGMTLTDFAKKIGVTPQAVSRITLHPEECSPGMYARIKLLLNWPTYAPGRKVEAKAEQLDFTAALQAAKETESQKPGTTDSPEEWERLGRLTIREAIAGLVEAYLKGKKGSE